MSIFTQLIKSMYSTKDIAKYRNQGIGKTILYILLLTLISAIPTMTHLSTEISSSMKSLEQIIQDDFPSFTIKDGQLSMNDNEPFIKELDEFTLIIDGSESFHINDLEIYRNALALLKDKFVLITEYQSQSIDYSMFEGILVNENDLQMFISTFESMMPMFLIVMNIILFILVSIVAFMEIFVLALFGLILKNIIGLNLKYRHVWILTSYSITLPTIFFTIMSAMNIQVLYGGSINWFVSTIILFFALKEIPKPELK